MHIAAAQHDQTRAFKRSANFAMLHASSPTSRLNVIVFRCTDPFRSTRDCRRWLTLVLLPLLPLALRPFRQSLLTMPLLALQGCATAPLVSAPLPPMVVDQGSNRGVPADSSQHPPERDKANTADWFCAQGKRDADWQCIESSSPHPTADGAVPAGPSPNVSASPAVNPTRETPAKPTVVEPLPSATDATLASSRDQNQSVTIPGYSPPAAVAPAKPRLRVLEQSPDAWAIQLIATRSKESLERVAAQHDLYDHPAVRLAAGKTIRYALVWDVYPDRARALAALAALPKTLRDLQPWVRNVGALQQAMNDAVPITEPTSSGTVSKPASKTAARASRGKTSRPP